MDLMTALDTVLQHVFVTLLAALPRVVLLRPGIDAVACEIPR